MQRWEFDHRTEHRTNETRRHEEPKIATQLTLYGQVENVIIDRISNGSLPAGSRLPSEL
jgi:DNA-binding GntR family transcriptional regulator